MARSGGNTGGGNLRAVLSVAVEDEVQAINRLEGLLSRSAQSFDDEVMGSMYRLLDRAEELQTRMQLASSEADFRQAERELRVLSDEAEKFTRSLERGEKGALAMQGGFRALQDQIAGATQDVDDYYDRVASEEARMDSLRERAYKENVERDEALARRRKATIDLREKQMRDYFDTVQAGAERVHQSRIEMAREMGMGSGGPGLEAGGVIAKRAEAMRQLRDNTEGVGIVSKRAGRKLRTNMMNQEMLRVIQDSQFGMLGMANNIQQIAERLAHLPEGTTKMQALGAAVKGLVSGPFAIATLVTVLTIVAQNMDKVAGAASWLGERLGILEGRASDARIELEKLTEADITAWSENTTLDNLISELDRVEERYLTLEEATENVSGADKWYNWIPLGGPIAALIEHSQGPDVDPEARKEAVSGFMAGMQKDAAELLADDQFMQTERILEIETELAAGVTDEKEKQLEREKEILEAQRERARVERNIQALVQEHNDIAVDNDGTILNLTDPSKRPEDYRATQRLIDAIPRMRQRAENAVLEAQQEPDTDKRGARERNENLLDFLYGKRSLQIALMEDGIEKRVAEIRQKWADKMRDMRGNRSEAEAVLGDPDSTAAERERAEENIRRANEMLRLMPRVNQQEVDAAREKDKHAKAARELEAALRAVRDEYEKNTALADATFGANFAETGLRQQEARGGFFNMANSFDQERANIRARRDADLSGVNEQMSAADNEVRTINNALAAEGLSDEQIAEKKRRREMLLNQMRVFEKRRAQIKAESEQDMTESVRSQMALRVQYMQQGMATVGNIFGQIAQMQDEQSRAGFERKKKMLYAQAVMDAISSGVGIYRSWFTPEAPGGPITRGIMATLQSAQVLATGMAKAKKIQGMTMDGGAGAAATGSFTQSTASKSRGRMDRLARERGERRATDRGKRNSDQQELVNKLDELPGKINDKKVVMDKRTAGQVVDSGNNWNTKTRT